MTNKEDKKTVTLTGKQKNFSKDLDTIFHLWFP